MNRILLVLFTIFFVTQSRAELTYSQRILYNSEFQRTEQLLTKQETQLQTMHENYKKGSEAFGEARTFIESVFVYALQELYKKQNKTQFKRLAILLNQPHTRDKFYYPVTIKGGISGDRTAYVAWKDVGCINLIKEESIHDGVILSVDKGFFSRWGDTSLTLTEKYYKPTKNKDRMLASYILAKFEFEEDDLNYSLVKNISDISTDAAQYYNCRYATSLAELQARNINLLGRYHQLAQALNLKPKNFKQGPQQEKGIVEKAATEPVPNETTKPSTPTKEQPKAQPKPKPPKPQEQRKKTYNELDKI